MFTAENLDFDFLGFWGLARACGNVLKRQTTSDTNTGDL